MTTKITSIYNEIESALLLLFPTASGFKKMSFPYDVLENERPVLNKGWGFYFGPSFNTSEFNDKDGLVTIERDVILVLSRINIGSDKNIIKREETEKLLYESQLDAIKALRNLNSESNFIDIVSDSGIEFAVDVDDKRSQYLFLQSTFNLRYTEFTLS